MLGSGALSGEEVAALFRLYHMEPEFADLSAVVLMLTPENRPVDFLRIAALYRDEPAVWTKKETVKEPSLRLLPLPRVLTIREAMLSPQETVPVAEAVGRILARGERRAPLGGLTSALSSLRRHRSRRRAVITQRLCSTSI